MDQTLKKKWVEALRSGSYKQGRHYLKTVRGVNTNYCCLGVLCELMGLESEKSDDVADFKFHSKSMRYQMRDVCTLPDLFCHDHEIDTCERNKLVEMNDGNVPFDDIADYIENNL